MKNILFLLLLFIFIPVIVQAHPGRTASDGCHYCRTRCDYWGETWNARHCHGGNTAPTTYTPPTPTCPSNSYVSGNSCVCKVGYSPFQSTCVKIPANAHAKNSSTDAWECDYGYEEKSGSCVIIKKEQSSSRIQISSKSSKKQSSSQFLREASEINREQKEETESIFTEEDLEEITSYIEELEKENPDSGFGSFLSGILIAIGGFVAYKKFKK